MTNRIYYYSASKNILLHWIMKQQIYHESDNRNLSTVAVLDFSHAPEILLHKQSLANHGAVMMPNTSIENIKDVVQQKIAAIVDQSV